MSRRYGFSASSISRIISASHAAQHRNEVNRTIAENSAIYSGDEQEYFLNSVDLKEKTRMATLLFQEETTYRTIDRYVTRDYVRYPVYSDLKKKTKEIHKTLRLTNEQLENLPQSDDELIATFASDIVLKIGNEDLYPSWLLREIIEDDYQINLKKAENDMFTADNSFQNEKTRLENKIGINLCRIEESKSVTKNLFIKLERQNKVLKRIGQYKKSLFLDIVTFSIHYILGCPNRKSRHEKKKLVLENKIQREKESVGLIESDIDVSKKEIARQNEEHERYVSEYEQKVKSIETKKEMALSEVQPLPLFLNEDSDFVPLKDLAGLKIGKIVGCYVIRNRENKRCYVGQSKDVMKRVSRHFEGTIPKNYAFFTDYFSSKLEDKRDLFEIKITPLATKDELDGTEKELIQYYDSFQTGYNGTNGND